MERRLIYSISYTLKVDNRCRVSVCWPYRVVIISIPGFLNSFVNKKDPKLWEKSLLDTSWAPGLPRFSRGLTVGIGPSYRLCLFLNPESARAGKINKYPHGQHVLLFSLLIFPPHIFLNETQEIRNATKLSHPGAMNIINMDNRTKIQWYVVLYLFLILSQAPQNLFACFECVCTDFCIQVNS